jgi:Kef-type K+ transport system membrane component KefB
MSDGVNKDMFLNFTEPLNIFLIETVLVITVTRTLGILLDFIGQPRVIAEVLGGIILGPTVMGRLLPGYMDTIFPMEERSGLSLIANLGLLLYLYLVGIEMNLDVAYSNIRKTSVIASMGIIVPVISGYLISPFLYNEFMQSSAVNFTTFTCFICVAISITAFPVLCRILNETGIIKTTVGITTLGAAAIDDVVAWCMLAISISMINTHNFTDALYIFLLVVSFAIFMFLLVRPLWHSLLQRLSSQISRISLAFLGIFLSSWVTSTIGVHGIFGAFLFGLIMPRNMPFTLIFSEKIEEFVQNVFLPLYFALSGLNTNIHAITVGEGLNFLIILAIAILSKFVGCTFGALCSGLSVQESTAIGVLMNTRGLVELIVLNVALNAHIISEKLFTLMIFMALTTTMMTTPLLRIIYPHRQDPLIPPSRGALHFIIRMYEDVSEIIAIISLFHYQNSKKILISALTQSSSSTTDIVRATNNLITPKTDIIRIICSLMNIAIDYKTVYGDLKFFESEITQRSSAVDMTIISYNTNEYNLVKNMINKSIGKILLFVPGQNEHRVFMSEVCVDILFIVTDLALIGMIQKLQHHPHVRIHIIILLTDAAAHTILAQIRWHQLFNDATSFPDILRILDQYTFDFIITHYSKHGLNYDLSFPPENDKDIRLLGTIGTFLLINHKKSTLLVLHSDTPFIDTVRADTSPSPVAHTDDIFFDVNIRE